MVTTLPAEKRQISLEHLKKTDLKKLGNSILSLMNLSGVDTGRATHYNTKEEIEKARSDLHRAVFMLDRTIYGCLFCLPGVNDYSKQKAVSALLAQPRNADPSLFDNNVERQIVEYLITSISQPNRIINLFVGCTSFVKKNQKGEIIKEGLNINNARTRTFAFQFILNAPNLELWAVKYRGKLEMVLTHMWGIKTIGVLRKILVSKSPSKLTVDDKSGLEKYILSYVYGDDDKATKVLQCVSFILGRRVSLTLPTLKAFEQAKKDPKKLALLPLEIAEGLATTFHPELSKADLLKLTKGKMTAKKKRLVQKTAKKAGVKIDFDPMKAPMVDLYIYAMEMGWTKEIGKALRSKAQKSATALPFRYETVGILVDDSNSSSGSLEQKRKPLAVTLATRDMLSYVGKKSVIAYTSGRDFKVGSVIHPLGDTALADGFLSLIEQGVDAVFVISDGYENAPAGRFSEVLSLLKKVDCCTPIYHINPVASAESGKGVRVLDESIPVMPISQPEQIALTIFKAMLQTDPKSGIIGLVNSVLPAIEKKKELKEGGDAK